ncbi:hypothetical protein J2Y63_006371 [Shinella sp. BE166]|uniref:hypothetical protein n=1 Tax=Shinella sp. BE166 TaxID=3373918 RepID=UPI003EBDD345
MNGSYVGVKPLPGHSHSIARPMPELILHKLQSTVAKMHSIIQSIGENLIPEVKNESSDLLKRPSTMAVLNAFKLHSIRHRTVMARRHPVWEPRFAAPLPAIAG